MYNALQILTHALNSEMQKTVFINICYLHELSINPMILAKQTNRKYCIDEFEPFSYKFIPLKP